MSHSPFPRQSERGFSLTELVVVISVVMVASAFSVVNIVPVLRNARVERAHQTTIMQMRRARQLAIDQRRVHIISFTLPRTIQIQRRDPQAGGGVTTTTVSTLDLPSDIEFRAEPGIPTGGGVPDGFGSGSQAIDFNNGNQVFFQPDGAGRDAIGRISNGIVYLARPGELDTARAATLFGTTGRIKGWKLVKESGSWVWR